MRLGQVLGNVTFIERPFHPTTLVSVVGSAVRGRRRQYQTRAILEDLTESEGLLQTALNAGHLGALELHLPELELEASDTCKPFFGRRPDEPFSYPGFAGVDSSRRSRAAQPRCWSATIKTGTDYSIEYRNIWPDGSQHWVDVRARAVRRPDGSIKSLVGVSSDITARKVAEIERENSAGATGRGTHRAGRTDRDAGAARRATHRRPDEGSRRARKGAGAVAPGAEDGDHRSAHRRRRARLQQSPDGGDGQSRSVAQAHP